MSKEDHPKPRTLICERHELLRSGLKAMIAPIANVIGEASDGMTAIGMMRRLSPDLIILDADLDKASAVDVCREASKRLPNAGLIIHTDSYHATKSFNQLTRAGARGFCLKCSGPHALSDAIQHVMEQQPYCDPEIRKLVKQAPKRGRTQPDLTDRDIEVLTRLDLRNKEISEELDMELQKVEKHIESILKKLNVPTRADAALKAVRLGYVLLPKVLGRDAATGKTHEQIVAERYAHEAIRRGGGK